ncbi:SDR family NAD(P)-dependent oxidoreductase [Acinetobacter sp. B5B]|uniref:SDR family NAD(P)-dependent oxidoreductase n=1 Tax=Acinetobacter baretiae TaxID=2605383 RepID=UPI0018C21924|nr:SDR family NAD(P)-dependent oxidoreductase [Acinetobacter baretiae]MBF7683062.1 SDR family NAD(P)-dependent oxidoreductase [Acinetobacter baretiae]
MLALVTGASSGFGYDISKTLIDHGYKVIGIARRSEKLNMIQAELGDHFLPLVLDLSDRDLMVEECLYNLPDAFCIKNIDVLVNNAGLALGLEPAHHSDLQDWQKMIDTNITGLVTITRWVLPHMVKRGCGIIVNIGSIAATYPYPGGNVYGATKAFVQQFSLNLTADLVGTGVKVSNIEPGLCGDTEFSMVRFKGDLDKVTQLYDRTDPILPQDIANTVWWIISQPAHINVNKIEMMPTSQSFNALKVTPKQV